MIVDRLLQLSRFLSMALALPDIRDELDRLCGEVRNSAGSISASDSTADADRGRDAFKQLLTAHEQLSEVLASGAAPQLEPLRSRMEAFNRTVSMAYNDVAAATSGLHVRLITSLPTAWQHVTAAKRVCAGDAFSRRLCNRVSMQAATAHALAGHSD